MLNDDKNIELVIPGTSRTLSLALTRKASDSHNSISSPRKSNRKLRYALGGLTGLLVFGLYAYYHTRAVRPLRTASPLREDPKGGHFAEDGSFLANLGPSAENAFNLGVTDPEQ
jgi:hypothetical protein